MKLDKTAERPVECRLYIFGEKARRQLLHTQVIADALAAKPLFGTRVGAIANLQVHRLVFTLCHLSISSFLISV